MKMRHALSLGIFCLALLMLALPRPAAAVTVGLKFYGGYNNMNGGDINKGLKGWFDLYKTEATLAGATVHGDYEAFHGGMDAGGDLIIYFSPIIGIGFGASFLQAQSSSELTYALGPISGTLTIKPQVKAIPIRAGLYFAVPMGSLVNLTLNAGAEYFMANVKYSLRIETTSHWDQNEIDVDSKGKIGFCGGLGVEIKVHPNFSILLEGRGRYARLDGFEGKQTETDSGGYSHTEDGKLWYAEILPSPGYRFPLIVLSDTPPPSDPSIPVHRSARLDINGFSALAGIMVRF